MHMKNRQGRGSAAQKFDKCRSLPLKWLDSACFIRTPMLHLQNLTKDFAGKPLFTGINWHLKKGERVGLVGDNGAGKSTLLRIIAGEVEHSAGELQFAKGGTVGYLPQDGIVAKGRPLFAEAMTALTELQS